MPKQIETKITSSILWSVLMRWSMKFIGLISTIILARILVPEDFGLVAMATLVIGLIEELSTVNISLLLIRNRNNDRRHNDTAWTVGILQSLFVVFVLFIIAPYAADYFNDKRVIDVIYILAFIKLLAGFQNIGIVIARKELNFALDYRFYIYKRLATFVVVIFLALLLQNYWSIVYGTLIGEAFGVWLSYKLHPYRPRVCWEYILEYVRFSIPMIPLAVARLLNNKFDVFIVGGSVGTAQMGIYNIANELGSVFTKEVILPATRGLFPNFARLAEDRKQFNAIYVLIISASVTFCIPVVVGMWLSVDDLVYVLLGEKWVETAEYLKWLVVFGAVSSVTSIMSEHSLIALKMEHMANKLMWLRLLVLIICVLIGYQLGDVLGVAIGMAVSALINLPIITLIVSKVVNINIYKIMSVVINPLLSVLIMYLFVQYIITPSIIELNHFLRLIIIIFSAGLSYSAAIFSIWYLKKKPEGIEMIIAGKITNLRSKLRTT